MKLKNDTNKIDWKAYKEELTNRSTPGVFNEYERDLHTMTVKEGPIKKSLNSSKYLEIKNEMTAFDKTDFDYFKYEKDLNFGEFDD
jgi:hypothetical protein